MRYGSIEYAYAAPIAEALAQSDGFKKWIVSQTRFSADSDARLLHEEMRETRSQVAENWWRSHFTETCRCRGCSGQETDLLAIFERPTGGRFALHCEIKQPLDKFPSGKNQGINYNLRARCWSRSSPRNVLSHDDADTVLFCSKFRVEDYGDNAKAFGAIITFQQIAREFPEIGKTLGAAN
ncbi:MAG: hypothetical protein ABL914_05550 [Novosphingobium sp.]|uniref:hypothetical protein n=1 Tax=Novosphingobium sp. TaxID=1874826 RepID=UPI0032BDDC86